MPNNVVLDALPGYDAETDTNPSHFNIYLDGTSDHILVKEKVRGTESVNSSSEDIIDHDLAYFPFNLGCVEVSAGEFQTVYNAFGGSFNPFYSYVTTADLILGNQDSSARVFSYIIFHDQL